MIPNLSSLMLKKAQKLQCKIGNANSSCTYWSLIEFLELELEPRRYGLVVAENMCQYHKMQISQKISVEK